MIAIWDVKAPIRNAGSAQIASRLKSKQAEAGFIAHSLSANSGLGIMMCQTNVRAKAKAGERRKGAVTP